MLDLDEIKSRINPVYQDRPGTESDERKMLCDEIDQLRARIDNQSDWMKKQDKLVAELKEKLATQKAYYESVFEDGARRIARLTEQRDLAVEALRFAANINPFGSVENAKARDAAIAAIQSSEVKE
jgi:hypothetical protein